jgi:RimJ/RimL family protein N-acetyltransferase
VIDDIVFTTARLALRLWRDDDEARVDAMKTPAVQRGLVDDDMPAKRGGSQTDWARAMQAEHGHCFWVVERRFDGQFLGYCGLKRVDSANTPLTGTSRRAGAWRRHIGGRAMPRRRRAARSTAPLPFTTRPASAR